MTTSSPLLSVIIPNWNGYKHLDTCLKSLATQTYKSLEVIVVDNGSSDESIPFIQQNYPWVKLIELGQNWGFVVAINRGIVAAQGEIVAPLNNDTEVTPTWAAALVEALQHHPEAGLAASKMRLFTERHIIHSAGDAFGRDGIPINRGVWTEDQGQFDDDIFIFGGCGGAVAYTKTMLHDIGLFDEDLFMYCEDVDLNWRAQLAGYRCIFVPKAVVYHHLSATGGGEIASYYTGRNTLLVLAKSVPGIVWRQGFLKIIGAQLRISGEAARAWRGKAARARLKGQLAGLMAFPRWLLKRPAVQVKKRVSDDYLATLLED